ncbi:hypothetical protein QUH71_26890 (plasmid) [Priestia aryabhattai]|uniref:hypothetical protein n=1 Tax=Priestia aryabhattai TaxID=412384 RepID=UPI0025A47D39|nr:hypothetical protein [Priestia aryabhattai]WJN47594.1 hypothetical protein QUH71_26890 [Priestia aryabhattai]
MGKKILILSPMIVIASSMLISCSNGDEPKEVSAKAELQQEEKASLKKEIKQAKEYIRNKEYSKVSDLSTKVYNRSGKVNQEQFEEFIILDSIASVFESNLAYVKSSNIGDIPLDYKGEFKSQLNQEREALKESLINDIAKKDFKTNNYSYTKSYQPEYYLSLYFTSMKSYNVEEYTYAYDIIKKIPNSYKGIYAEDIEMAKNQIKRKSDEITGEWAEQERKERVQNTVPQIGMTKKEVINDTNWGKPEDIKRTTTQYGIEEQWIYSGYRYLYFEDGKLAVIQD